jgi:hypothetical protein
VDSLHKNYWWPIYNNGRIERNTKNKKY